MHATSSAAMHCLCIHSTGLNIVHVADWLTYTKSSKVSYQTLAMFKHDNLSSNPQTHKQPHAHAQRGTHKEFNQ